MEDYIVNVQKAKPVWGHDLIREYNQFLGFHTCLKYNGAAEILIAARSYYRLYINGEMTASGPARTAEHFCRVDEISVNLTGETHIAVEVVALNKPEKYCNDCTMEPGLFLCEVIDEAGRVLQATGEEGWTYTELTYRLSMVETMSHSRGILEAYELTPESFLWRTGKISGNVPILLAEKVSLLKRHTGYPTYKAVEMDCLTGITDIITDESVQVPFSYSLASWFNASWYAMIPQENRFVEQLLKERDSVFTGHMKKFDYDQMEIMPGIHPAACIYERRISELGFIDFTVTVEKNCVIDLINTDHRSLYGEIHGNSYVTRYSLTPGNYHLTTFEPKLTRYIKMIFRTEGAVRFTRPILLQYTKPEESENYFACSDGDLNRIYDGAKRTLRLNSLDIYMDCPQRERGGWLCDSQFNGSASWMLFGDLSVERDFIENFLLTDAKQYWKGFFPEVYPGVHKDPHEVGIPNWSFWLMTELYDYYCRSGDRAFVDRYSARVEDFVEGMLSLRGESGLLENITGGFVDWSLSNQSYALEPISVPNNCLAVCVLERLGELYGREGWLEAGARMRNIIEEMDRNQLPVKLGSAGDAAVYENGSLRRGTCRTEAGMALELWCGFHQQDKAYIQQFVNALGTAPEYRPNPNVGRANLFIGLMIRFEVLSRLGRTQQLIKELKDVYLQELRDGSGTFFENIHALSGCHAFNSEAGALIANDVLGLGQPLQSTKSVRISPHPGRLRWANGTARTCDGVIIIEWGSEPDDHRLDIRLLVPEGWKYEFDRPFELFGWTININGESLC